MHIGCPAQLDGQARPARPSGRAVVSWARIVVGLAVVELGTALLAFTARAVNAGRLGSH